MVLMPWLELPFCTMVFEAVLGMFPVDSDHLGTLLIGDMCFLWKLVTSTTFCFSLGEFKMGGRDSYLILFFFFWQHSDLLPPPPPTHPPKKRENNKAFGAEVRCIKKNNGVQEFQLFCVFCFFQKLILDCVCRCVGVVQRASDQMGAISQLARVRQQLDRVRCPWSIDSTG